MNNSIIDWCEKNWGKDRKLERKYNHKVSKLINYYRYKR